VASYFCFPLSLSLWKMASMTCRPEANLVAMSISSLAIVGDLQPNFLTSSWQDIPVRNALMTSESVVLESLVCCLENW
jgi:hypothetical protein